MNARIVLCALAILVGCGDVAALTSEEMGAAALPPLASEPPPPASLPQCECADPLPVCGQTPLVDTDGACGLVFGEFDTGGAEFRMDGGETFAVWQGPDVPSLYMERQANAGWARATFIAEVVAGSYATRSAPLLYGPTIQILPSHSTVRVVPNGSATINLPRAVEVPGRRFTIKIVGDGAKIVIQPAFDAATGLWDDIDGAPGFVVDGGTPVVTLEAYDDSDGAGPDKAGWILISP